MNANTCCELCKIQDGVLYKVTPELLPLVFEVARHGVPKALNSMGGMIFICSTCHLELEARKQIRKNDKAILISEIKEGLQ